MARAFGKPASTDFERGDELRPMTRRQAGKLLASSSALLAVRGGAVAAVGRSLVTATAFKVEWRIDPVGIDTSRPRFRWRLQCSNARPPRQAAFRLRVIADAGGERRGEEVADSGWVRSGAGQWRPAKAIPLRSHARYSWQLAIRTPDGAQTPFVPAGSFVTGILGTGVWQARWIAARPDQDGAQKAVEWRRPMTAKAEPMPLLRGQFDEARPVRAAFLSVIGLGQYWLAINGAAINEGELSPAWSDFARTLYYDTYDVTAHLSPGRTIISAMLGNGFFNVEGIVGRYTKFVGSYGSPRLLLQLRMIFANGEERIFCSDEDWSWAPGPIVFSSIYGGEDHDARRHPPAWLKSPERPEGFAPVTVVPPLAGRLIASPLPPMKVVRQLGPPAISEPVPDVLVADFGINFAGRPKVTLQGLARGQAVTMKPGELLGQDGQIDQRSATGTRTPGYNGIAFSYTASGAAGGEQWAPRFSYTGFRYLQLEGVRREQIKALSGEMMHLAVQRSGRFTCSDDGLVRIHKVIEQAFLSNLASVLTDCPHREKLGWLEQAYLNAPTAFYNRDCAALYEKIAADMRDAQLDTGMVPSIAPEFVAFVRRDGSDTPFRDSPEWGCAMVLAPWAAYRFYGDAAILADNYAAMGRYASYLEGRAVDGIVDYGLGDWFDVGPARPGPAQLTSKAFTGSATLQAVMAAMARVARILSRPSDAAAYRRKAANVAAAINRRFFDSTRGTYDRGSQAAQAMALSLGIAPPEAGPAVLARLIADIEARRHHVSAGDVGFHYVVDALTRAGRAETLYAMLKRPDPPSYGAQIARGATALTEAWDADPGSSQNHFMLGHAEAWLFGGLGGINVDFSNGEAPLRLAPQPVGGVEWSDVSLTTVLGEVRCAWRQSSDSVSVDAEIPAGGAADMILPVAFRRSAGSTLEKVGSRSIRLEAGRHRFSLPIGS